MPALTITHDPLALLLFALGSQAPRLDPDSAEGPASCTREASTEETTELLRRAGQGDRRAFEQIFDRHADDVFRWLTRLVGPVPEREDLVQEVFLAVHRGLGGFRGDARFSTWLHRVVANIACSHLRRRRRRPPPRYQVDELPLAADVATPEEQARQREQIRQVLQLLERIKPKKRVAFILRVVEGLSLGQIAHIVGARPPAVGQRVKHARRELQQMLRRRQQGAQRSHSCR